MWRKWAYARRWSFHFLFIDPELRVLASPPLLGPNNNERTFAMYIPLKLSELTTVCPPFILKRGKGKAVGHGGLDPAQPRQNKDRSLVTFWRGTLEWYEKPG
jgi:hypothetical protein